MGAAGSSRTMKSRSKDAGFTLIELMVVLLILAMLTTIAAPRITKYLGKAKSQTAAVQVEALTAAVDAFVLDVGRVPSESEGLQSLLEPPSGAKSWDGPYIKKAASLTDPWGRPYRYRSPGRAGEYDVFTFASDDREGGDGDATDIGSW